MPECMVACKCKILEYPRVLLRSSWIPVKRIDPSFTSHQRFSIACIDFPLVAYSIDGIDDHVAPKCPKQIAFRHFDSSGLGYGFFIGIDCCMDNPTNNVGRLRIIVSRHERKRFLRETVGNKLVCRSVDNNEWQNISGITANCIALISQGGKGFRNWDFRNNNGLWKQLTNSRSWGVPSWTQIFNPSHVDEVESLLFAHAPYGGKQAKDKSSLNVTGAKENLRQLLVRHDPVLA